MTEKKSAQAVRAAQGTKENVRTVHIEDSTDPAERQATSPYLEAENLAKEAKGITELLFALSVGIEFSVTQGDEGAAFLANALHQHTKKLEALRDAMLQEKKESRL